MMLGEMNRNLMHGHESRETERLLKKSKKSHDLSELISIPETKFDNSKCEANHFPSKLLGLKSSVFGTCEKTMSWCASYSINDECCSNENIDFLFPKSISIPEEHTNKELHCNDNWFIKDVNSEFLYAIYSERLLKTKTMNTQSTRKQLVVDICISGYPDRTFNPNSSRSF